MKALHFLPLVAMAVMATSCGNLTSDEKAELDSLRAVTAEQEIALTTANEFVDIFNSSIDSVLMNEDGIIFANDGESPALTKEKIQQNLDQYSMIVERQKKRIEELQNQLGDNKQANTQLRTAIAKMQAQLEAKEAVIADLRTKLNERDLDVANLRSQVRVLNQNVSTLTEQTLTQQQTIQEQDAQINTGYYVIGSSKELKKSGVLSGGFLKKKKVATDNLDVSMFTQIDIRSTSTLTIPHKKAKVMSQMPSDSYTITDNGDGTSTLTITDKARFWSQSSFLIVSY